MINFDQPELVSESVRRVVAAVRGDVPVSQAK
jgi:hypothetical protein